jgi:hypothetical protein
VTFTGLFRGRRGTEPYVGTHSIGDTCYIHDAGSFVEVPAREGQLQIEVAVDSVDAVSTIHTLSRQSETDWVVENVRRYDHWQYTGLSATADPGGDAVTAVFRASSRNPYENGFADSTGSVFYDNPPPPPLITIALLSAPYNKELFDIERSTKSIGDAAPPGLITAPVSTYILFAVVDPNNGRGARILRADTTARGIVLTTSEGGVDRRATLWGVAFHGSIYGTGLRYMKTFVFPGTVDYRASPYEVEYYGIDESADGGGGAYKGAVLYE